MTPTPGSVDEGIDETFPASDPPSHASPITIGAAPADQDDTQAASADPHLEVYRIVPARDRTSAFRAQRHYSAGRWTSDGTPVLYAALSAATAMLEFLAHLEGATPDDLVLAHARLPRALAWQDPPVPADWHVTPHASEVQRTGDAWLAARRAPGILVPSALLARERNILLDPLHPDFGKLQVVGAEHIRLDPRLRT